MLVIYYSHQFWIYIYQLNINFINLHDYHRENAKMEQVQTKVNGLFPLCYIYQFCPLLLQMETAVDTVAGVTLLTCWAAHPRHIVYTHIFYLCVYIYTFCIFVCIYTHFVPLFYLFVSVSFLTVYFIAWWVLL